MSSKSSDNTFDSIGVFLVVFGGGGFRSTVVCRMSLVALSFLHFHAKTYYYLPQKLVSYYTLGKLSKRKALFRVRRS